MKLDLVDPARFLRADPDALADLDVRDVLFDRPVLLHVIDCEPTPLVLLTRGVGELPVHLGELPADMEGLAGLTASDYLARLYPGVSFAETVGPGMVRSLVDCRRGPDPSPTKGEVEVPPPEPEPAHDPFNPPADPVEDVSRWVDPPVDAAAAALPDHDGEGLDLSEMEADAGEGYTIDLTPPDGGTDHL